MKQEYIKGDIVMYDNKIHTIMDALGVNNYELSYIEHPVHQLELSGVPLTPEIIEKNGWKIEDVNPNDLSNIVSKGIMYRAIKDKEILFFHKGTSVFTCPLNWRKIEIRYVHQLQHLLFGLGLNSEMEVLV